ncbi:16S rRNA m5C967 methyltransferase, S-adenosyl-L-methionine-dependent [Methylorubrum populi]|uniref:16S rRNA m5C967 methyltransferase, S-adenosyl-L-methionine-dependent n=1 Tax=Methylorubrum populi TaxID=223967 RepID=A0A160PBF5_9HYPH|nr:RsmB/NOP family class I SAM-dependent RNA methyltransferase [Methylorubrum populi]BAU89173.1 16S rRNA m5C967 methyltransferase, S-adenosyl-L-methionine-dependent [Methylorubrum populi]
MASTSNRQTPPAFDATVPGLAARHVAREAVATLLGPARGLALEDALAQAGRVARLDAGEAALARAIATASFRRLGFIKAALAARLRDGLPVDRPHLLALLVTGAAQILDLAVADHAAVDLSVRLAKADAQLQHLAPLVNAVLRRIARQRDAIRAQEGDPLAHNTPDWLARRWRATYGEAEAQRIAAAHLEGAAVDLTVPRDRETWAERLGGLSLDLGSIRLAEVRDSVAELPGYAEGAWWVQDAAAALPVRLLAPGPGERVADLCAAPGGKTAQIAAAGATVTAVDRSAARLERLGRNLERLGLSAEVRAADALELPEDAPFDAVLLDAPCSATGTIRRHPDVAWTKSETDVIRLAGLQRRLLDKAARLTRPGGRLVYCTCSLESEEGGGQIADFLNRNPDFERIAVTPDQLAGHAELIDAAGDLRTLPSHLAGGTGRAGGLDGFFASVLRQRG